MSFLSPSVNSVDTLSKETRAAFTTVKSSPNVSRISTKPMPSDIVILVMTRFDIHPFFRFVVSRDGSDGEKEATKARDWI